MYPSPLGLAFISMLWTTLCGDWLHMYGSSSPNRWFEVHSIASLWFVSDKEIDKCCFVFLCPNNIGREIWIGCPSGPRSLLRLTVIGIGGAATSMHVSNEIWCDNNSHCDSCTLFHATSCEIWKIRKIFAAKYALKVFHSASPPMSGKMSIAFLSMITDSFH